MTIKKSIPYDVIRSSGDFMRDIIDRERTIRDREDIYIINQGSLQKNQYELALSCEYMCVEVNINPDYDW